MPFSADIYANGDTCVKAVERFAEELSTRTALRLEVSSVPEGAEMEFIDVQQRTRLRVEWLPTENAAESVACEWETGDEMSDGANGGADAGSQTIRHYGNMVRALAHNGEAAKAFLDTLREATRPILDVCTAHKHERRQ